MSAKDGKTFEKLRQFFRLNKGGTGELSLCSNLKVMSYFPVNSLYLCTCIQSDFSRKQLF